MTLEHSPSHQHMNTRTLWCVRKSMEEEVYVKSRIVCAVTGSQGILNDSGISIYELYKG